MKMGWGFFFCCDIVSPDLILLPSVTVATSMVFRRTHPNTFPCFEGFAFVASCSSFKLFTAFAGGGPPASTWRSACEEALPLKCRPQ